MGIEVYTRVLTLPPLSDERLFRLNLINDLYGQVMDYRQIAYYLNDHGIETPHGGRYTPKLVWLTQKKYTDRLERILDSNWSSTEIATMKRVMVKPWRE